MTNTKTFTCRHCNQLCKKNYRIKSNQHYCGDTKCQQARKNRWEKEKLKNDPLYRSKRKASKKAWYKKYPGDRYQTLYRDEHPGYVSVNREKQNLRNKKCTENMSASKIVKTDALIPESLYRSGLYEIIPYKTGMDEKVVKTDALIVEIRSCNALSDFFQSRGP